ncbi:MAG: class I tRNA ligase family protein, partial [Acetobacteraceae bacterium]
WFSSALWPFSTLGWPEQTPELQRYYPGDVLVTGFDIIFFWVARMMMMGHHFMHDVPFRTVYIHGLVRDARGQKMSKSKGNIIDPLQLIDRYGADALRFAIIQLTGPGRDIKLGSERVEATRSFITKIWNAARFSEMNGIRPDPAFKPDSAALPLCRWVLDAANRAIGEASAALEAFRFDEYGSICYRFAWHLFCDWFVELAKPVLAAGGADAGEVKAAAAHVLGDLLRLLHPAIPFVTEELWDRLGYGASGSLMLAAWPEPSPVSEAPAARNELDWVVRLIGEIRTVRAEMNVPPATQVPILLKDASPSTLARAGRWREAIGRLARVSEVRPLDGEMPGGVAQAVVEEATVILPLAEIVDLGHERARLDRERGKVGREAERLKQKLADAAFISRAPEDVVEENRERLTAAEAELARLEAALRRIA